MAQQREEDIHPLVVTKQTATADKSAHRSTDTTMLVPESSSVATDQYHHSETIWRVVIDIVSLIICKIHSDIQYNNNRWIFSGCYNDYCALYCYTIYTRFLLFGYRDTISIQRQYNTSLCCGSFINRRSSCLGTGVIFFFK